MNPISNNTSDQWLNNWQDLLQKGVIHTTDPLQQMNTTTTNHSGIFGGVINDGNTASEPYVDPIISIRSRIDKLELDNMFLRLKILSLEGKFTQEEVANMRKMLIAEDESARTLVTSIIENA
jgi:hypothetical protein